MKEYTICPHCKGSGNNKFFDLRGWSCPQCHGIGKIIIRTNENK